MDDILNKFGARIKHLREKKKITQTELAKLAGLHRTYIVRVENGCRNVALKNVAKLAKSLDCTLTEIFKGL